MPFWDLIWSMFMFFLLIAWIWVVVSVISDVFRSKDIGGFSKAFWVLFVILIPWLGVLSYILIRGKGMEERNMQLMMDAAENQRTYIQGLAGTSTADELSKLAELKDKGVINDTQFEAQKAKLLG
jgi:Short C-terminal domain/Phospholipase_D-nuclease N-terminal